MILAEKSIFIRNNEFLLTNQRAMFWPKKKALVFSDLHLGKTAHFRKNGIALPSSLILEDLKRLSRLILHYQAEKLMVVGDFLHAGKNSEFEIFKDWKSEFSEIEIMLIKGNHDKIPETELLQLGISEIHFEWKESGFVFSHDFTESEHFLISGHIHPGLSLKTGTRRYLKFPCFVVCEKQLILPAFSSFTGLDTLNHPENATYYFFSEEGIYQL